MVSTTQFAVFQLMNDSTISSRDHSCTVEGVRHAENPVPTTKLIMKKNPLTTLTERIWFPSFCRFLYKFVIKEKSIAIAELRSSNHVAFTSAAQKEFYVRAWGAYSIFVNLPWPVIRTAAAF